MLIVIVYTTYKDLKKCDHILMIIKSSGVDKACVDRNIVILNDNLMLPSYTKLVEGVRDDSFSYQEASKFNSI
jgi:riboflavin transporter FmnP